MPSPLIYPPLLSYLPIMPLHFLPHAASFLFGACRVLSAKALNQAKGSDTENADVAQAPVIYSKRCHITPQQYL